MKGRYCVYRIERRVSRILGETAIVQPGSPISAKRVIFPVEKLRNWREKRG